MNVCVLMTSVFMILRIYAPCNDRDVDEYNDNINATVDDDDARLTERLRGHSLRSVVEKRREREREGESESER